MKQFNSIIEIGSFSIKTIIFSNEIMLPKLRVLENQTPKDLMEIMLRASTSL